MFDLRLIPLDRITICNNCEICEKKKHLRKNEGIDYTRQGIDYIILDNYVDRVKHELRLLLRALDFISKFTFHVYYDIIYIVNYVMTRHNETSWQQM